MIRNEIAGLVTRAIRKAQQKATSVAKLVKDTMERAYDLKATLKVDTEAGPNWYELAAVDG